MGSVLNVIQHNMMAMFSDRQLGITTNNKAKSTEKLSSGYRINRAADDAAGLSISEKMRKQIRGLNQGKYNIQDGISTCQIMDGALAEVDDMLHRMTELSVKAANGTLSESDRADIQHEIKQLSTEIDRVAVTTKFNEIRPLCQTNTPHSEGGKADIIFAIDTTGSMSDEISNVKNNLSAFTEALTGYEVQYGIVEYKDVPDIHAVPFTDSIDDVSDKLGEIASSVSGGEHGPEASLDAIMKALDYYSFRKDAAKEIILVTDADYHYRGDGDMSEISNYTASEVKSGLSKSGVRLSVVTNSSYLDLYSKLANGKVLDIGSNFSAGLEGLAAAISETASDNTAPFDDITDLYGDKPIHIQMSDAGIDRSVIRTYNVTAKALGLFDISCLSQESATSSIDKIEKVMGAISAIRSEIGAEQNGLEHAYKLRDNTSENTTAAESRIRDTNMAGEMVRFSNLNVLQQAGQSMLTQANQSRDFILSLLQ